MTLCVAQRVPTQCGPPPPHPWIRTRTPSGHRPPRVWPVHQDPRCLILKADLRCGIVLLVSAHAPNAAAPPDEVERWWVALATRIRAARGTLLPTFVGIDANARLGSIVSPMVGAAGAQQQDAAGDHLHAFALELDLCAPAALQGSPPHGTWRSNAGRWHRIDYVLVPPTFRDAVVEAAVAPADTLAIADRVDHAAPFVRMNIAPAGAPRRSAAALPAAAPGALTDPLLCEAVERQWRDAPPLPALWSADGAAAALTARASALYIRACPCVAPVPRRPWVTAGAWAALRQHAACRSAYFRSVRAHALASCAVLFCAWASGSCSGRPPQPSAPPSLAPPFAPRFRWAEPSPPFGKVTGVAPSPGRPWAMRLASPMRSCGPPVKRGCRHCRHGRPRSRLHWLSDMSARCGRLPANLPGVARGPVLAPSSLCFMAPMADRSRLPVRRPFSGRRVPR